MRALDPALLRRTRSVRPLLVLDVALGVATVVPVLAQAGLLAAVVARSADGATVSELRGPLVLLGVAFAVRGLLAWATEVAGRRAASNVMSELRLGLTERRLADGSVRAGPRDAEVATTAVQGVDALEAYFARYLPQVVLACVIPPAVVAWVATVDVRSALIMLLTLPLVPVFMWLVGRYTEQRTREHWEALQRLSAHFLEVVRGLPTLRAFNRGRVQAAALADVGERYRRATMGTLRVSFLSGSVLELAATLGVALVAVTVGVRLVGGGIGLQAAMTVLVLAPELYLPLRRLGAEYHASADGLGVAARMFALLDAPAPIHATAIRLAPSPSAAPVRLERVSFAYPGRCGLVLDGLDLEIAAGETVALTGASGAGKSTIAALLVRLLEPDSGRVTVGGVDLAGCSAEAWRRQVAWLPQHPTMLRGTVHENIALGEPSASAERVRAAAALAGVDRFVEALPDAYDTRVGDGGRPLSAGERRRIGLARALVREAPLLVLDEPTADLDPEAAAVVEETIEGLGRGRSVLVIAHRARVADRADRVVVVEDGRATTLAERQAA